MKKYHLIFFVSIICIMTVGYVDNLSGTQISMMLFYAVPILATSWYCGKVEGIVVASTAAFCWFLANFLHLRPNSSEALLSWNALTRFGIFLLIAYTVSLQASLKSALRRESLRADTDRLTGLLNMGAFKERVEEEINRAQRYRHSLSLAFIDLDNFKLVNDINGHTTGDILLQHVSESILNSIRSTDIAGRIGGDEFTICFPETGEAQVKNAVKNLLQEIGVIASESGFQVTASIGVVTCLEGCAPYDVLLGKADKLMYVAKEKGKNAAEFISI